GVKWHVAHWRGLVAPRGLPPTLGGRYLAPLRQVANDAGFAKVAADNAFTVRWRFDGEFARYMEEDDRQFGHVIQLLDKGKTCVYSSLRWRSLLGPRQRSTPRPVRCASWSRFPPVPPPISSC